MPNFRKQSFCAERKLCIPDVHKKFTDDRIDKWRWEFLNRELVAINTSWVHEFYFNYYTVALDSVYLFEKQILVTEAALQEILQVPPKQKEKGAYEKVNEA
ncbi:hypothetical protein AHAS_Ahas07G0095700 [Arachis hypogaea]